MSLSQEQKQTLEELSKHLRSIEQFALSNNIDLDVYMTQYSKSGIAVYGTEKITLEKGKAEKRKRVFEKSEKSTKTISSKASL